MRTQFIAALLGCTAFASARAQSSFLAADGRNRYPGVTIFCPNGTGVQPCNFGAGGGGATGAVSLTQGGAAVSATNRLPVADTGLDGLIVGGALSVSGMVGLVGSPTVTLGASASAVGSVSVSNFPATQPISGSVGLTGSPAVTLATGTNAVGSVTVSNFPPTQPVSGNVGISGTPTVTLGTGTNAVGSVSVSNFPATQPVSGTVSLGAGTAALGSVSVTNLPATQPVSAASLPLPSGAATAAGQTAALGPVAPAAATATNTVVIGCTAATALPSFSAGQQGAVPCDTSGRPYVVTVPSANNVPGYLQAVSSGGATPVSVINAAASAMPTLVKAGGGMIYGYSVCNNSGAAAYFRLFNQATAPSVGTSTPVVREVIATGSCARYESPVGFAFGAGIGLDMTAGSLADSDATTIATANTVTAQVFFK